MRKNGRVESSVNRATPDAFRICFVCTGNICRSPMAEVITRTSFERLGLAHKTVVTSRGTGDWHVGERADYRTLEVLAERGYNGDKHRARQFDVADFAAHDLIIALDQGHARALHELAPSPEEQAKIELLLSFVSDHAGELDVFDPYYSDHAAFRRVLEDIERACAALVRQLEPALRHGES